MFIDYYHHQFPKDLLEAMQNPMCQYKARMTMGGIHFMDVSHFHGLRLIKLTNEIEKNENPFNFSVAIYFTNLVPQVIKHIKDTDAMDNFHRCSSWPQISCGLGGVMDPIHTLWEAHLMPNKGCNVELLIETIKEAEITISQDVTEFLQGGKPNVNEKAYQNLISCMSDKIDNVKECIHDAVQYFIDWILAPTLNKAPNSFQYYMDKNSNQ